MRSFISGARSGVAQESDGTQPSASRPVSASARGLPTPSQIPIG
jgi:hypothetical protein